jgi:hypothetical protein
MTGPSRLSAQNDRMARNDVLVLVFGPVTDAEAVARLGRRWSKRVEISNDPCVDPVRAGVPTGGLVLIRPDGHIGFRFPSADAGALAALDRHLSSYLIPDLTVGPIERCCPKINVS